MSTILGIPDATMDIPKPTTGKLIVVTPSNPTSSVILPQSFYFITIDSTQNRFFIYY